MTQSANQPTRQVQTKEDNSTRLASDHKVSPLRQRFIQDLELAGLSPNTVEAYVRAVRQLSEHFWMTPDALSEQQVRDYLSHLQHVKQYAAGTLKIAYGGLKWFFKSTCPRDWQTLLRLKPPKQVPLPDVLTPEETQALIGSVRTQHNRVCLWTIYSCGLRLAEGCHLQLGDVDAKRGLLHVHRGKGAIDRFVPLPESTILMLRQYWMTHRNPTWLFPARGRGTAGQDRHNATRPTPRDTVQGAFRRVVQEAGLKKRISVHSLRHSYATQLIERGVNIRLIQQYLGHRSLQHTVKYLHMTRHGQEHAHQVINQLMQLPTTDFCDVNPAANNNAADSQAVGNGQTSLRYLARYVSRTAISNSRIVSCQNDRVTYRWTRSKSRRPRRLTVDVTEFIRRFLQHVLPAGFQRIRHYGFLNEHCKITIDQIRGLLGAASPAEPPFDLPNPSKGDVDCGSPSKAPRCPNCARPLILVDIVFCRNPRDRDTDLVFSQLIYDSG